MPNWLKKALVTLITVCTFGLVTPPSVLLENAKADKSSKSMAQSSAVTEQSSVAVLEEEEQQYIITPAIFVTYATEEAERQSMLKFGSKIKPVIKDEFKEEILPRIEETLAAFAEELPQDTLQHVAVSQRPAGGANEKIFHVYDSRTGQDLLRFHVRRDNPPKEGYYFNFHYHTVADGYATHHELGNMYWGKNTPPQWLS